jgi:hypothetical protein
MYLCGTSVQAHPNIARNTPMVHQWTDFPTAAKFSHGTTNKNKIILKLTLSTTHQSASQGVLLHV